MKVRVLFHDGEAATFECAAKSLHNGTRLLQLTDVAGAENKIISTSYFNLDDIHTFTVFA